MFKKGNPYRFTRDNQPDREARVNGQLNRDYRNRIIKESMESKLKEVLTESELKRMYGGSKFRWKTMQELEEATVGEVSIFNLSRFVILNTNKREAKNFIKLIKIMGNTSLEKNKQRGNFQLNLCENPTLSSEEGI
ncbi:MAG: hypothetical protein LBB06_00645 [Endomicrobium sp.]|jgi:hypothetical protein|nr:hypothetical protein [Endomicrobium sp.]